MSSISIYQSQEVPFKPTFLYIKQHSITGKLYFGKTIYKDPVKYPGSGKRWCYHINKNGKEHVETLWHCLFTEKEELVKFAIMCSGQWDIVKSKDWLNLKPENGLDGGNTFDSLSLDKQESLRQNRSRSMTGELNPFFNKTHSNEIKDKISKSVIATHPGRGMKQTLESNNKRSDTVKNRVNAFNILTKEFINISKIDFDEFKGIKYIGSTSKIAKLYKLSKN